MAFHSKIGAWRHEADRHRRRGVGVPACSLVGEPLVRATTRRERTRPGTGCPLKNTEGRYDDKARRSGAKSVRKIKDQTPKTKQGHPATARPAGMWGLNKRPQRTGAKFYGINRKSHATSPPRPVQAVGPYSLYSDR